jgi:hypothetical protein
MWEVAGRERVRCKECTWLLAEQETHAAGAGALQPESRTVGMSLVVLRHVPKIYLCSVAVEEQSLLGFYTVRKRQPAARTYLLLVSPSSQGDIEFMDRGRHGYHAMSHVDRQDTQGLPGQA